MQMLAWRTWKIGMDWITQFFLKLIIAYLTMRACVYNEDCSCLISCVCVFMLGLEKIPPLDYVLKSQIKSAPYFTHKLNENTRWVPLWCMHAELYQMFALIPFMENFSCFTEFFFFCIPRNHQNCDTALPWLSFLVMRWTHKHLLWSQLKKHGS